MSYVRRSDISRATEGYTRSRWARIAQGRGGGGKGGGGASRVAQEDPNTLRSRASVSIMEILGEGEIVGLVDGAKSIFFDQTAVQNTDGTYNFQGVGWDQRFGLPDQTPMPGFSVLESEVSVGVEVTESTPVTRALTNLNATSARVTVRIPSLATQDTSNGDLHGGSVEFKIEVQPDGGSYQQVAQGYEWQAVPSVTGQSEVITPASSAGGIRAISRVHIIGTAVATNAMTGNEWLQLGIQYWNGSSWVTFAQTTLHVTQWTLATRTVRTDAGEWSYIEHQEPDGWYFDLSGEITGISSGALIVRTVVLAQNFPLGAGNYTITPSFVSAESLITTNLKIVGKCVAPYERSYRFQLPGSGPWNIRMTRVTPDATSSAVSNKTFFSSYTEIIDSKLIHPDTALIALTVDTQLFGGRIPRRSYRVRGRKIKVPSNYDTVARTYDGVWDGNFVTAYSNNPAWVLYDVLTNDRFGLGDVITAARVDKWTLYNIGVYCDDMVPDTKGGVEPRFTFNGVINTREDAYKVLQTIASVFRGMMYWGSGVVVPVQDAPTDVSQLVTPANVLGGKFNYSGSALKARHTVCIVTWFDPDDHFRPAPMPVEDLDGIARYGIRQIEVTAAFCTSRGQAYRLGRWLLDSEKTETEVLTYKCSLDHAMLAPGAIIDVADPNKAGVVGGGRIASATTTALTLDRAVELIGTGNHYISAMLPNGEVEKKLISNGAGSFTVINMAEAFSQAPITGAVWVLSRPDVAPRKFRVINVKENEKHEFEITALAHDPNKYARVEENVILTDTPYFVPLPSGALKPPENVTISEYLYDAGTAVKSAVTVSWSAPDDPRIMFYELQYSRPNEEHYTSVGDTSDLSSDVQDTFAGTWSFRVRSFDQIGRMSAWTTVTGFLQGVSAPPADVENFSINFIDGQAHFTWTEVGDLDAAYYMIKWSPKTDGTADWSSAIQLSDKVPKGAASWVAPAVTGTFFIKAFDQSDNESQNAAEIASTAARIFNLNAITTLQEDLAFSGTHTDTAVSPFGLRLDVADNTMDTWTTLQSISTMYFGLSDEVSASGIYQFFNDVDLGGVFTSRVTANIEGFGDNLLNVMSGWLTLDTVVDLSGTLPSDWNAYLEIRTSEDALAGSPTWSAWRRFVVGDYTFRSAQFRLVLASHQTRTTPTIRVLRVQVDMPDRVDRGMHVAVPISGLSVTYTRPFKEQPSLGFNVKGLQTGDYWELTAESRTGFTLFVYDTAGNPVARHVDWWAHGWGYEEP
jgi:predicted phage tail protein